VRGIPAHGASSCMMRPPAVTFIGRQPTLPYGYHPARYLVWCDDAPGLGLAQSPSRALAISAARIALPGCGFLFPSFHIVACLAHLVMEPSLSHAQKSIIPGLILVGCDAYLSIEPSSLSPLSQLHAMTARLHGRREGQNAR